MALNKSTSAGTVFLSVSNGKLVRQFREATKESISRVNKTGKTVHEEQYRDLIGTIVKIETKENDYGKQWIVTFKDGDDTYVVQMPYSGRYSSSFLKALPNVTSGQPVKFMPWEMADKNDSAKKVTGVTMYQNDGNGFTKIPPFYTKEEPNGLPQMKQIKVKGKQTWDDTDMMAFLEDYAKRWCASIISSPDDKADEPAPF